MGYRECRACERRFLSTDGSEYCSQSCFERDQARSEERPGYRRPLAWTCGAFGILLLFLAWDTDASVFLFCHAPVGQAFFARRLAAAGEDGQVGMARAVADGDPELVAPAVRALLELPPTSGARAKAAVLESLRVHYPLFDDELKALAITFFGRFGHGRTDRLVLDALHVEGLREAAAAALGERGVLEGLGPLVELLKERRDRDGASPLVERALVALGRIPDDEFLAVPVLCLYARPGRDPAQRRLAARSLGDVYVRNVRQSGRWTGKATGLAIRRVALGIRELGKLAADEDPQVKESAEAALSVTKGNRDFGARYDALDLFR